MNLSLMPKIDTQALPISLQRRSQRLLLRVPIQVCRVSAGKPVSEQTSTLAINAHGALITLKAPISDAEQLVVKNLKTGEEQPCRVVYVGPTEADVTQVGIEFVRPSPQMWGIVFPPQDWNPNHRAGPTAKPQK